MADAKISALTSASTPLAGTEVLPIVQNNTTVKVAVSNLTAGRTVYSAAIAGNLAAGTSFAPKNVGFITPDSSAYANPSVWNGDIENVATFGLINLNSGSLTASKYQAGVVGIARVNGSGTPGASNAVFGVLGTTSNAYGGGVNDYAVGAIGKVYVSDNVVIGTAGKGIDFSANTNAPGMTSELLDWYEEGTWTATLTAFSSAPTTPVTVTAYYTRVGRQITCAFAFKDVDTTGASGPIQITGLPFTPALTDYRGAVQTSGLGATISTLAAYTGSATMELLDATNFANVNITAGTGKYVVGTITYFV